MFENPTLEWVIPKVSALFPIILLLLKMKMIVMITKVASTSTASMATIAPAINSPRLFEPPDTTTGSRETVVDIIISLISPGSVASIALTVGRSGVCSPLLGVKVGLFVGYGALVVN